MGSSSNDRRIIPSLMGTAHLISLVIGVGIGIAISSNNNIFPSGPIKHQISQDIVTSDAISSSHHRKAYATTHPSGKKDLRGKTFTLEPTNALTSRPVPTTSPTMWQENQLPFITSSPTSTSLPASQVPTKGSTSAPSTFATRPTASVVTKQPTKGGQPSHTKGGKSAKETPTPSSSADLTENIPEDSEVPSPKPSDIIDSFDPTLIVTSPPTTKEVTATASPSSSDDMKCTCVPTSNPFNGGTTPEPTSVEESNTGLPTVAVDNKTLSPTVKSDTSSSPTYVVSTSNTYLKTDSPTESSNVDKQVTLSPTLKTTAMIPSESPVVSLSPTDSCGLAEEETCCGQPPSRPQEDKEKVCLELGCDLLVNCPPGIEVLPTPSPSIPVTTLNPTVKATSELTTDNVSTDQPSSNVPSIQPSAEPSVSPRPTPCNRCHPEERESCCSQSPLIPLAIRKRVCKKLGCKLHQCKPRPTNAPSLPEVDKASSTSSPTPFPTSAKPTLNPTDEPTKSSSPTSVPPFYTTLPTRIPTVSDTLPPTSITDIPTVAINDIPFEGIPEPEFPTYPPTSEATQTVSKETTGPPTAGDRDPEVKQLGSNDYRPSFVFTSKIQTSCTREEGEEVDGVWQVVDGIWTEISGGCILHCTEITKLYEGESIINESSIAFKDDCPHEDSGDDGTSTRIVEHTITSGGSEGHTRSITAPWKMNAGN